MSDSSENTARSATSPPSAHRVGFWVREVRAFGLATDETSDEPGRYAQLVLRALAKAMTRGQFVNSVRADKLQPDAAVVAMVRKAGGSAEACDLAGYVATAARWRLTRARAAKLGVEGADACYGGLNVPRADLAEVCQCSVATIKRRVRELQELGVLQRLPTFKPLRQSSKGGGPRRKQGPNLLLPGEKICAELGLKLQRIEMAKRLRAERRKLRAAAAPQRRENQGAQIDPPTDRKPQPPVVSFSEAAALRAQRRTLWTTLRAELQQMRLSAPKVRPLARPEKAVASDGATAEPSSPTVATEGKEGRSAPAPTSKRRASGAQRPAGRRSRRRGSGDGSPPRSPGDAPAASTALDTWETGRLAMRAALESLGMGRTASDGPVTAIAALAMVASVDEAGGGGGAGVASPPVSESPEKSAPCEAPRARAAPESQANTRPCERELSEQELAAIDAEEEARYAALRNEYGRERPSRPMPKRWGSF